MDIENQKCVGVVFSDRAYKDIKAETEDKDPVETGGILLGHVLSTGHWVVVEVIPPGDNSTHQYAYFEYDEHFVNMVADQIANKYEQKLELLGLWHRHPGSMDFFSGTDDGTNIKFAEINPSFGAISGLVNIDPRFRITMYHVDSPLNYTKVETFFGDDIIPAELLKLKDGVKHEDIDAIKKQKKRPNHQPTPSSDSQPVSQPGQATPTNTASTDEQREKQQVIIERPETLTGVLKKFVLEHAVLFCLLLVFIVGIGVFAVVYLKNAADELDTRKAEIAAQEKRDAAELEAKKAAAELEAKREEVRLKMAQAEAEVKKAEAQAAQAKYLTAQAKAQAAADNLREAEAKLKLATTEEERKAAEKSKKAAETAKTNADNTAAQLGADAKKAQEEAEAAKKAATSAAGSAQAAAENAEQSAKNAQAAAEQASIEKQRSFCRDLENISREDLVKCLQNKKLSCRDRADAYAALKQVEVEGKAEVESAFKTECVKDGKIK